MATAVFRAAIGAFIVNGKGKLLVTLKHGYKDKWHIIRGGIEQGESPKQALTREIKEELGTTNFRIIQPSMINKVFYADMEEDGQKYIGQAWQNYWVLMNDTELKVPNDEIEKVEWIDISTESIAKYLGRHDDQGTLQRLMPIEWKLISDQTRKSEPLIG